MASSVPTSGLNPTSRRRLAVVTGASSGIGAEFARQLAARGHDLVLVARRRERLQSLADELVSTHGIEAHICVADLGKPTAESIVLDMLEDRRVEVLVLAAGYSLAPPFNATTWKDQHDFLTTTVVSVAALAHAVLPGMVAQGRGTIFTLSSLLALSPGGPGHTLYPAAKSFVLKFSLSLDAEVRAKGVRVTCVLPGSTSSEFQTANGTADAMKAMPGFLISTPKQVVESAFAAAARGQVTVIPGWHNQLAALVFKLAPTTVLRALSAAASRRFAQGDPS